MAGIVGHGMGAPLGAASEIFVLVHILTGANVAQKQAFALELVVGAQIPVNRGINGISDNRSIGPSGEVVLNNFIHQGIA